MFRRLRGFEPWHFKNSNFQILSEKYYHPRWNVKFFDPIESYGKNLSKKTIEPMNCGLRTRVLSFWVLGIFKFQEPRTHAVRLILIVSKKRGSEFLLFWVFFGNFLGCQDLDGLPYRICNFASKLIDFRFCALPLMPKYEPRIIAMLILATTWWLWRQKNNNISQGCRVFFRDFEEALSILEERHYVA